MDWTTQPLTAGTQALWFLNTELVVESVAGQNPAAPAGAGQHIFATGGRATVAERHSAGAVS